MRLPRLIVLVVAGLILVVGAGFLLLRVIFPPQRIRAEVVKRAEAATGYDLALEDAGLHLSLRGIEVRLEGVSVRHPARATEDPVLRLERLDLGVELFPLLARELKVTRLSLTKPRVFLYKDARGVLNAKVERPVSQAGQAPAGEKTAGLLVAVPAAHIEDGTLLYIDEATRTQYAVEGLTGDLKARVDADTVRLGADLAIGGVRADMRSGGGAAYGPLPLALKAELAHAPGTGVTLVRGAELGLAAIQLRVDGRIDSPPPAPGAKAEPVLDLSLVSGEFEPEKVLSLVGQTLPQGLRVAGKAKLSATVRGPAKTADMAGSLTLSGVDVTPPDRSGPLLTGVAGEIGFTRTTLAARNMRGALAGTPFQMSATVENFAKPEVTGDFSFTAKLTDLAALATLPPGMAIESGTLAADLDFATRAPDFVRSLSLRGTARGENIAGKLPAVAVPLGDLDFDARLSGRQGTIEPFRMTLGRSDLSGRLALSSLDPPRLDFALNGKRIDLDELMGPQQEREPATTTAAEKDEKPFAVPMRGTVRADELIYKGLVARNASFIVALDEGGLRLDQMHAALLGGTVDGNVVVNLADPDSVRYTSDLQVKGVEANEILTATTPIKNLIHGKLDGTLDLAGVKAGDSTPLALLDGLGNATVSEGYFAADGPLGMIASQMGLLADGQSQIDFQRLVAAFQVDHGRVKFRDTKIGSARSGEFNVSGSLGLDGTLDYAVAALLPKRYLPPDVTRRPELVALVTDGSGRVPVDFRITGTVRDPQVTVDLEKIQKRVVAGAEKRVEAEVQKEVTKQFDKAVKEAAKGLEGLFGKKKPAASDSGKAAPPR